MLMLMTRCRGRGEEEEKTNETIIIVIEVTREVKVMSVQVCVVTSVRCDGEEREKESNNYYLM